MRIGRPRSVASSGALTFVMVFAAACGGPEQELELERDEEMGAEEVSSGTESDRPMMHDDQRLQQHMQEISTVSPDSLVYVMPMHLEKVGAILDEMDPAYMGMQSDTVWRTTLDSVQNDLALMRDMGAEELRVFMPEHSRRIDRLIFLHDSAMGAER